MRVVDTPVWWRTERQAQRRDGLTLGFVPTMGALHEGHQSLVRRSLADNDRTLVSIFVNPTQFDDGPDLELYPRTLEADLETLTDALEVQETRCAEAEARAAAAEGRLRAARSAAFVNALMQSSWAPTRP